MKTKFLVVLVPLLSIWAACEKDEEKAPDPLRITGRGEVLSELEVVNPFTGICLEGVANVYVTTGQERKVVLTAYENILPYLDAHVVGDELLIRFNEDITVNSDKEIRVDISVPNLKEISLTGVGNFHVDGSGQESLSVNLEGVGNVYAFGLPLDRALVNIDGNGNVEIDAKDELVVDIDGLGNVYYKGSPQIRMEVNGLGEVVQSNRKGCVNGEKPLVVASQFIH